MSFDPSTGDVVRPLRTPLVPLTGEALRNKLREQGLDENRVPLDASPLEKEAAAMVETTTPAPVPAPEVKSGWKTTEHWALMILLGGLAYCANEIATLAPKLAAAPGVPAWVALLMPVIGLPVLGWIAKRAVIAYQEQRVALKLPADPEVLR